MSATATLPQNFPSMIPTAASTRQIISICPMPLEKTMTLGNGFHTFRIAAQDRGSYQIITVGDTYQFIRSGFEELDDSNPSPGIREAPVPAAVLANSLVNEWNRKISPVGSMGVAVLPPGVEEGTPAFNDLLRALTAQVRELAEWAIRDANDLVHDGKGKHVSDQFHRVLAKWLMGDSVRAIPWYNASAIDEMKNCCACNATIKYQAAVCKECGTDLRKYFAEYNLPDEADPYIASLLRPAKVAIPTQSSRVDLDAPPAIKITIPSSGLPDEIRAAAMKAVTAEHKAMISTKSTQASRDAYIIEILPDLCMKNATLKELVKNKGYVVSDAN